MWYDYNIYVNIKLREDDKPRGSFILNSIYLYIYIFFYVCMNVYIVYVCMSAYIVYYRILRANIYLYIAFEQQWTVERWLKSWIRFFFSFFLWHSLHLATSIRLWSLCVSKIRRHFPHFTCLTKPKNEERNKKKTTTTTKTKERINQIIVNDTQTMRQRTFIRPFRRILGKQNIYRLLPYTHIFSLSLHLWVCCVYVFL